MVTPLCVVDGLSLERGSLWKGQKRNNRYQALVLISFHPSLPEIWVFLLWPFLECGLNQESH